MPTLNPATSVNDYQATALGTAGELSLALFNELEGSGYSLIEQEVWAGLLRALNHYAAWATFEAQLAADVALPLDEELPLYAHEWTHIKPLARAECDVMQAYRMEADRSMGMEGFGVDVNTAMGNLNEQKTLLGKAVYVCEPEFIELE